MTTPTTESWEGRKLRFINHVLNKFGAPGELLDWEDMSHELRKEFNEIISFAKQQARGETIRGILNLEGWRFDEISREDIKKYALRKDIVPLDRIIEEARLQQKEETIAECKNCVCKECYKELERRM